MKKVTILSIILFSLSLTISVNAQMMGTLSLPGLGGAANANAATYPGDGVILGSTIFTSKYQSGIINAVMWHTGLDLLGAKYTAGIAQPRLFDGKFQNGFWPVTVFSPVQLSWGFNTFNLQLNYSYFHGHKVPMNAHLVSVRGTQYLFDQRYSLNGGVVYEYRMDSRTKGITYGDAIVFETNISRHFKNGSTIGMFGYYNTNASPEYHGSKEVFNEKSTVSGLGIDANYPVSNKLFLNGKYILDTSANKATRSNRLLMTVAYKF